MVGRRFKVLEKFRIEESILLILLSWGAKLGRWNAWWRRGGLDWGRS